MGRTVLFLIAVIAAGLIIGSGCTQTVIHEVEYIYPDGGVNFTPDFANGDLANSYDLAGSDFTTQTMMDMPGNPDLIGKPDQASSLSFSILNVQFDFLDKGMGTYDIVATDGNVDDVWVKATRLDTNKLVFDIWQLYTLTSATTTNVPVPLGSVWRFEVWTWAVNSRLERDGCIAVWTQRCYKQYDVRNFAIK